MNFVQRILGQKWFVPSLFVIFFLIGLFLLVGRHLVRNSPSTARSFDQPIPVRTSTAEEIDLDRIIGANGIVQPIMLINLSPKVSPDILGEVVALHADIGDLVEKGEPLIEFDSGRAAAIYQTALAEKAEAALDLKIAQSALQQAQLANAEGLSLATLEKIRAAREQAEGALARANLDLDRVRTLFSEGLVAKQEVEGSEARLEEARFQLEQAKESYLQTRRDLENDETSKNLAVATATTALRKSEEKLQKAETDLKLSQLTAPVTGIVLERAVGLGELPRPGTVLATLGQIDAVLIEIKLAEEMLDDIYLGQEATVTLSAFPKEDFLGAVVKIKPATDPKTKSFLAYVKVANPSLRLRPGLSSFVRLKKQTQGVAVPSVSLLSPTQDVNKATFVVDAENVAQLRPVTVSEVAGGKSVVTDGLRPGDKVVTVSQYNLRSGDKIRIGD
ncbi:MAG: hypothetical protein C0621_02285 [Desulfuromonas sp.]|nr:MAG: hypothetical protein C0621_02285 [Desulfuromonas sp.]